MGAAQKLEFVGAAGHLLAARLHRTPGTPRAHALFAHCFTCSKDVRAAVQISQALAARGIATLSFDFTGLGESEGDFADTSFSSNLQDLVAAASFMEQRLSAPRILLGHSLGGAAVLAAAAQIPSAVAVATVGAPADPAHVRRLIDAQAPDLSATGEAEVTLAGRPFRIKQQFLDDLETHCNAEAIGKLGRALLVLHSPQDDIVDVANARRIFEAARHPKSFVSLDGAAHLLRRPADGEYVGAVIAAWASRYLPEEAPELPRSPDEKGVVRVTGGPAGFVQRVAAGKHILTADEPESLGGTDTGPTPYDLLLAGLGACTSMTLRMYADRKQWPLESVDVRLTHGHVHAADCQDCESDDGKVDVMTREIVVTGELDDMQRTRLLEIADKCPVHRTLENEIKIRTTLT